MAKERELQELVRQIEGMVETVTTDRTIPSADIRRVLSFIAKVVQVVDQAFQDVFATLIEFKHLTVDDLRSGRVNELRKQLDLLRARSRYRDAEEICSRLSHLRTQYEAQIEPVIMHLSSRGRWRELLWLIEEREGRIIMLVDRTIRELARLLEDIDEASIPRINSVAAQQAESMRISLQDLRSLSNEIMGLSGQAGFLELTTDRDALTERANIFLNRGAISMTRDIYSAGQAGAMGPGAHAHDMTFQQIWNQTKDDLDLSALVAELSQLRQVMREQAVSAEHDIAIGEVAAAEAAAAKGNGPTALEHLKKAGKWALDVATKIGVSVAAAALKTSLGL